jgi:hypothetical protein
MAVFVSLRSFLLLQLLSAIVLFAVLFVVLAALVAVFVALVVGFDHIIQWTLVALISLTRSFTSWSCDVRMLPHHASVAQRSPARRRPGYVAISTSFEPANRCRRIPRR